MRYDYFFELAKKEGLEETELYLSNDSSTAIDIFRGEIEQYNISSSAVVNARGIYGGKFGSASTDTWNKATAEKLVRDIKENAKVIEQNDPAIIFEGSEKYHKINYFNRDLAKISISDKINKLFEIEEKLKSSDARVVETSVSFAESQSSVSIINSKGLKLSQKSNYFYVYAYVLVKVGEQTKSGGEMFISNDFAKLDVSDLVAKAINDATSKLGGTDCPSQSYKAVLSNKVVSSFLNFYIGNASAEDVQKNSSLFIGKLGQKIASRKVTIEDKPLQRTVFCRYFDDEGVATSNRPIIKQGVLQTYLYNLTTAMKDQTTTTGNGFMQGGKIGIAPTFITLKPGKKSLEELFREMGEGVYITEVNGLHAGLNPQSGDFSLQSTGFLIENGKISKALDMITVSGNLIDIFKDVINVGNDTKLFTSSVLCPSVLIKKINVAGK